MSSSDVHVRVNGKQWTVEAGTSLGDFLTGQGVDPQRIAVERNGEVVPRAEHASIVLKDGDSFEVVQFVGGG